MIITDINQLDPNGIYTYADYLLWQFQERVEIIKGKILKMSPAPNLSHQSAHAQLMRIAMNFFHKTPCRVFSAPFDVRLRDSQKAKIEDFEFNTVVQPDLCVICDTTKLDERGCVGSPDLIIEILSPGNTKREMNTKFRLYEENQVLEYWLVEPNDHAIFVYTLQDDKYIGLRPLTDDDIMYSPLFPELKFDVKEVFER